ncbi:MAG: HAD family hydrolase [Candidatus Eisenbacteria bacterium]|uniref:HAD family hydrolase n=1 Tax=Eiseniibacteriota bacterium TaxID=2212470 RepID=A0A538T495_UNCEI|nr:MAG: HAD family hydrolase [Candidatus Eisenbacteria bacterium]TMQ58462.1 MAG: HAD family hydrolase [Candidatus Eisenbacteria bacterium]
MRLALFDIDGTLLREGIAPKLAFARALRETYDTTGPISGFRFAGMTDPQCVAEIMRMAGVPEDVIRERRDACLDRYVEHLTLEMRNHDGAKIFPGVKELLARLRGREDVLVGLLTGNVERGAWLKLGRFKLGDYFQFGAFGNEHEDRGELAKIAVEKAREILGRPVKGDEVTVIGDTPRDVACARAIGARAVIVATGLVAREELQAAEPDVILDSFEDVEGTLQAICP